MQIFYRSITSLKCYCLNVTPDYTIDQIKQIISDDHSIPLSMIKLVFAGRELYGTNTLKYFNILPETTIHLITRIAGPRSYVPADA